MYVLLPPSEGKFYPPVSDEVGSASTGRASFREMLRDMAFPQLEDYRAEVACELIAISERGDAQEILNLSARQEDLIEANQQLYSLPRASAAEVYTGVLFGQAKLDECYVGQDHGDLHVLISSALYGFVEPEDIIAPYRLQMQVKLGDLGALASYWKPVLHVVMLDALQGNLVLDARSGPYRKAWSPPAKVLQEHDIDLREIVVREERNGKLVTVSHNAKFVRGQIANVLARSNITVKDNKETACQVALTLENVRDVDISVPGKFIVITQFD